MTSFISNGTTGIGYSSHKYTNGKGNGELKDTINPIEQFVSHGTQGVEEIINILESRLPRSGHVYNMAKMYERFHPKIKVYSLYGSLNSDAILLLLTSREDYHQDICLSVPLDFKPTDEIKNAFASTQAIDWGNSAYMFSAVDRLISPMITEISTVIKGNSTITNPNLYFVMDMDKALSFDIKLPDEQTTEIRSLNTQEGVEFLVKHWKFSKDGTTEYTKRMVEKNPSSGLFNKNSKDPKVLSGIMTNSDGLVGMLGTHPEERQKGYAVQVMRHLLKQMALDGFMPCSALEQKNIASANFHKKVGMHVSHQSDYIIHSHTPYK